MGILDRYRMQGVVYIRGHQFVVAGKVCMDMVMVDLGPKGGPGESVRVGDYATLWGDGGNTLRRQRMGWGRRSRT